MRIRVAAGLRCVGNVARDRQDDRLSLFPGSMARGSPRRRISIHAKTGSSNPPADRRPRPIAIAVSPRPSRRPPRGREAVKEFGSVRDMNSIVESCSQQIFRVDLKMPPRLAADRQDPPAGVVLHDQIADSFAKRMKRSESRIRRPGGPPASRPPVDHERRRAGRPNARGDEQRLAADQPDPFGDGDAEDDRKGEKRLEERRLADE